MCSGCCVCLGMRYGAMMSVVVVKWGISAMLRMSRHASEGGLAGVGRWLQGKCHVAHVLAYITAQICSHNDPHQPAARSLSACGGHFVDGQRCGQAGIGGSCVVWVAGNPKYWRICEPLVPARHRLGREDRRSRVMPHVESCGPCKIMGCPYTEQSTRGLGYSQAEMGVSSDRMNVNRAMPAHGRRSSRA